MCENSGKYKITTVLLTLKKSIFPVKLVELIMEKYVELLYDDIIYYERMRDESIDGCQSCACDLTGNMRVNFMRDNDYYITNDY